jgi:hypothetical protein
MPPLTDIQRATVEDLASGPLQSVASLRGLVTAHVTTARSHAAQTALLDLDLAERLAAQCLELLTHHSTRAEPDQRLIQAACLYFAATDDEESDFTSLIGFEDDAEVITHIADQLGIGLS